MESDDKSTVPTREDEAALIRTSLIKRAEERLEFAFAINRFSDVDFFEILLKYLRGM